METPLKKFLDKCYADFTDEKTGRVPDYIPELTKVNPDHFGISVATIDGHLYEVGDTKVPFTIQSISKPFVFALALEELGEKIVESTIGVEPSGEAFNSIRLNRRDLPFNPMVNAGAIACSGLIYRSARSKAFDLIRETISRLAGRKLDVDDAVFESERATGDRNRAIAWLLKNYSVLEGDVDEVLDIYFRQCAILVTARDLAIMAATLANRGINPVTGEMIFSPINVARTLSVMTSSGMYDYAGEWVYRVGVPAKSGVGGGIIASLPSQIGLGTFSPRLDGYGNSVRGIKVCENISAHFGLHVLNRGNDVQSSLVADYDMTGIASRKYRLPAEVQILNKNSNRIRILELIGTLDFVKADFICRCILTSSTEIVILDFRRVPGIFQSANLLLEGLAKIFDTQCQTLILCGFGKSSALWDFLDKWVHNQENVKWFVALNDAMEWAESQITEKYGVSENYDQETALSEQALLKGLTETEIIELKKLGTNKSYKSGECIIRADDSSQIVYFLLSGIVNVRISNGAKLASLAPGMAFGEMALLDQNRTADVFAETDVLCFELTLKKYIIYRDLYPSSAEHIIRNLGGILSSRISKLNNKINALTK
jgi:glutaminase